MTCHAAILDATCEAADLALITFEVAPREAVLVAADDCCSTADVVLTFPVADPARECACFEVTAASSGFGLISFSGSD